MSLNDVDDLELSDRYQTVFSQFVELAPDVAKMLEKYARIKQELQILLEEMRKRKLSTAHPEYEKDDAPTTDK